MEKENEKDDTGEWLKDLPAQMENLGFDSEEMIRCAKCARTNPPTRAKCFYCGAELESSEAQNQMLKPNLRKLEIWEKGFNVIYLSNQQKYDEQKLNAAVEILKIEREVLRKFFEAEKPLPLARLETENEAKIVQKRLRGAMVDTIVLSDEDLAVEKPPQRLRGIEIFDDKLALILFNRDEVVDVQNEDLALVVTGAIFQKKIEAIEKRGKKGENKILQSSETASDEVLIDIYTKQNKNGFRIFGKGFDFSCLASEKGILAAENMKKLVQKFPEISPQVKIVDDYRLLKESLGNVWEVEIKNDSLGLTRESFGKFNMGNVMTVNNLAQFTKYSRLQWHLL